MHSKYLQRNIMSSHLPIRKAREAQAQDPSPKPTTLTLTFSESSQSTRPTSSATTRRTLSSAFNKSSSTSTVPATLPTRGIRSAMPTASPVSTEVLADADISLSFSGMSSASHPLPNGAVAGIVIACIIPIFVCFFILWKRSRDKTRKRLGQAMSSNMAAGKSEKDSRQGEEATIPADFRGQVLYKETTTMQNGVTIDVVKVQWPTTPASARAPAPLPSIYVPESNPSSSRRFSLPPRSAQSLTPSTTRPPSSLMPAVPTPVQGLYTINVARTFIPSLPDELSITAGETLRVLKEFDDGWAECERLFSGETGMVPLECFDLVEKIPIENGGGKAGSVFGRRLSAISAFGSVRSVSTGAATVGHGTERISSKRYTDVKGLAV